jgi:hypothetical protein
MHSPFQGKTSPGLYPGLKIREVGWLKRGSDIVIPPYLFVARDYPRYYGYAILQHGYGHYLQFQKYGAWKYYFSLAPKSILAAIRKDDHDPVEVEANKLAHTYFGKTSLMGGKFFPLK